MARSLRNSTPAQSSSQVLTTPSDTHKRKTPSSAQNTPRASNSKTRIPRASVSIVHTPSTAPTTGTNARVKSSAKRAAPEGGREAAYDDTESSDNASDVATDQDSSDAFEEADSESSEDEPSDFEEQPAKRRRTSTTPNKHSTAVGTKGAEIWRQGVKTGLGPGRETIIAKPKARPAGKTPYTDSTIHANTFLFLQELRENNDREWLKRNDPDYRASWSDFVSFLEQLQERVLEIDDTIPELPIKDIVFRIYRDIRFSPDPTPYKPYFSACWSRTGRKGPFAMYYVHLEAGNKSLVGGGLWHPEASALSNLRRSIARKPHKIREALSDQRLRRDYLSNSKDTEAAVRAFCKYNAESALKTRPKGYDASHPQIELLRLKNYVLGVSLTDEQVTSSKGMQTVAALCESLKPWVTFLNAVVMPDTTPSPDPSSDELSDDENENQ